MKARKVFFVMKSKAGLFPLCCNRTEAFFPSVRVRAKEELESVWRQGECQAGSVDTTKMKDTVPLSPSCVSLRPSNAALPCLALDPAVLLVFMSLPARGLRYLGVEQWC